MTANPTTLQNALDRVQHALERKRDTQHAAQGLITEEGNTHELITRALDTDEGHEALYWLLNRPAGSSDHATLQAVVGDIARDIVEGEA